MLRKSLLTIMMVAIATLSLQAQKLPKFGADLAKKSMGGKEIRVPYTSTIRYFGYVKPGQAPDEERDGKKFFYLYVWVPAVAPEIGVRMVSPCPTGLKPDAAKDFIAKAYTDNASDEKNYFDTWVTLERALDVLTPADIATKGKTSKYVTYDKNDDSSELPAQPSGSKYNSVLRVTSTPSDPMKALIRGLYRIGFTTYKRGEVQGSFYAEVGAPIELPGVVIDSSLDAVAKKAKIGRAHV